MSQTNQPQSEQPAKARSRLVKLSTMVGLLVLVAAATAAVTALLVDIFQKKQEAKITFVQLAQVGEDDTDPTLWAKNWPKHYDMYRRTVDHERTKFGGSEAMPKQKLDSDPWLRRMYSGYAFSIDYREARGHAYMLYDQEQTERITKRPQPGACLHCHASVMPLYRFVGKGDVMKGFEEVCGMPYKQAHDMVNAEGKQIIQHPVSCVDCHDPQSMALRVTRPGFINGIKALKLSEGIKDYDPNRDATRQEMRSYVCGQCHVEYYFKGEKKVVTYPWHKGLKVEQMEAYYDEVGFSDWKHGETGAMVIKAQHPEFEMWMQGTHSRAGVSCADCHMPYTRVGAMKITDHHIRSPLLNIARACQQCHPVPEAELKARAETIQERNHALMQRAAAALMNMIDAIRLAKANGASEAEMAPAYAMHRKAQWRLDFVQSENSMGFHAPQEAARILGEAIDYARQGEILAQRLVKRTDLLPATQPAEPVRGVTEPR